MLNVGTTATHLRCPEATGGRPYRSTQVIERTRDGSSRGFTHRDIKYLLPNDSHGSFRRLLRSAIETC
ncbi:hypothetical protein D8S78_15685 [Natrialba swarupiae]|nr:hypothetical protein [Natrialba swarupiae]